MEPKTLQEQYYDVDIRLIQLQAMLQQTMKAKVDLHNQIQSEIQSEDKAKETTRAEKD